MAKKVIQIVCMDIEYINRIAGRLAAAVNDDVFLEFITDEKYYQESITKPRRIDTLIIDEQMQDKYPSERIADKCFIISDESNKGNAIRKYEGTTAIINVLGDEVLKRNDDSKKRQCKIVGVVSPFGGCGKTIAALGIALKLSQLHRKVLYIDAENTQNFYERLGGLFESAEYADKKLAEALVNLTTSTYDYVNEQIVHGEFDYLPAFEKSLFYYHVEPEELCKLATVIASRGGYDYIVLEHEPVINSSIVQSISTEQRVVIVTQDAPNDTRITQFLSVLDGLDTEKIIVHHNDSDEKVNEYEDVAVSETVKYDRTYDLKKLRKLGHYRKTAEAVL
ncbi:AAA family ATPase [Butyrivibrio sp. INlla21]|uniref:AAA family ATPase n=1 Tax=Butyrivibrio sp. INlla21 TaxID=1520811 RepID=UPI0008F26C79|nr:AAA family ATPase [Butyrivibrio sp. INlla21]SFU76762.1 Chromosome partitioning ATPase, Mrp family, contains Fe-S cluster [Butyrivibrio sp. INlla21]